MRSKTHNFEISSGSSPVLRFFVGWDISTKIIYAFILKIIMRKYFLYLKLFQDWPFTVILQIACRWFDKKKFRFFTTLNNFDFFVSNAFFQDSEMKNVLQLKTLFIMSILLTFGAKIESCPTRTLLLNCVFQNSVKAQSTSFWTKIKPMSSAHYKHHVIYLQLLFTRTSGRYLR